MFGEEFYKFVAHAKQSVQPGGTPEAKIALRRLELLPCLINQAVGDALSDLLLVDAILQLQGQSIRDWNQLYQDLPSRQAKVRVKDRTIIQTNDNETKCLAPATVQPALDQAVANMAFAVDGGHQQRRDDFARAFIRASGTENVVRVYAEASTRKNADELAQQACDIVNNLCGGLDSDSSKVKVKAPALNSNL